MKKFLLSVFALFFVLSAAYSVTNMANAGFFDFLFGSDGSRSVAASASTRSGEHKLKVSLSYSGKSGTVTSDDGSVSCSKNCTAYYTDGETATLSATANNGYSFSKWSGSGCKGTGTCQVEMTKNRSVKAVFKKDKSSSGSTTNDGKVRLTVKRASSKYGGSVGISASYASDGSNDNSGVSGEYLTTNCQFTSDTSCVNELSASPSTVTITPISAEGAIFSKWSGCDSTKDEKCYLSVSGKSKTVKVYFKAATAAVKKKITVYSYTDGSSSSGAGGKVEIKKDGVSKGTCSKKCRVSFAKDTELEFIATANEGYQFEKWMNGCTGDNSECSLKLSSNETVRAYFTTIPTDDSDDSDDGTTTTAENHTLKIVTSEENNKLGYVMVTGDGTTKYCASDSYSTATIDSNTTKIGTCEFEYADDVKVTMTPTGYTSDTYVFGEVDNTDTDLECDEDQVVCSATMSGDKTIYYTFTNQKTSLSFDISGAKTEDNARRTYTIEKGDDLTVKWTAHNATECKLSGKDIDTSNIVDNASDDKNTEVGVIRGEEKINDIKEDMEFNISCESSVGGESVSYDFKVTVPEDTDGGDTTSSASCVSWRQTGNNRSDGEREEHNDQSCDTTIKSGWSGYCECSDGSTVGYNTGHSTFTCNEVCSAQ